MAKNSYQNNTKRFGNFDALICAFHSPITTIGMLNRRYKLQRKYKRWENEGRVLPMPHIGKYKAIMAYASRFCQPLFVETGTYKADMVYSALKNFEKIYSVELDKGLHERALRNFKNYRHVNLLQGDSAKVLPEIIKQIDKPCIFWLDAHCSGTDNPILKEIMCILSHPLSQEHIILIDDARSFNGLLGYPRLGEVKQLVCGPNEDWHFEVKDDIIRLHPKKFCL